MSTQIISLESEIKNFLVDILVQENKIDAEKIQLDSHLKTLDIDSFGFLEIIFSIEHQYKIAFPKNFEHIKTLQDVITVTKDLITAKNLTA